MGTWLERAWEQRLKEGGDTSASGGGDSGQNEGAGTSVDNEECFSGVGGGAGVMGQMIVWGLRRHCEDLALAPSEMGAMAGTSLD